MDAAPLVTEEASGQRRRHARRDGAPTAHLRRDATRFETEAAAPRQLAGRIGGKPEDLPESWQDFVNDENDRNGLLTGMTQPVLLGGMNAQLLQSVAVSVRNRSRGKMVIYNQKVPPDFLDRLERAARKVDLTPADYLRALVELHTEALE